MVIQYKCPNCGSDMSFNSETGHLSCPSCGRQDEIETFPENNILRKFDPDEAKEYHCENCGAVILTEAETTATHCSFCGAPVLLADRLTGDLAPAKVIPFTISKDEAVAAFWKWTKNGRLTPRGFTSGDRIKKMTGMYVPFWLYDIDGTANVAALATRVRNYTRGDTIYTETDFYDVRREIDLSYLKVPADASEKMDDELMDRLEPYDYQELKDFKMPYLAGFLAEKYDYDDETLFSRVESKIVPYIDTYIGSTISGYSTVSYTNKQIQANKKNVYYTLFPVWMVYYDFDNKEHTFAMNGQTGKVVGKPPISGFKVAAWFTGIAASAFAVMKVISFAVGGVLW
ncbi:TFIIB-type zinc ribbon-containing protein [Planococcus sp. CPCC 101016]|uniref:TFIIB-type zinc ribbon-containing protein n=1 Tax=Planococcus sp. CPCC 101016 TaxID=2599617 RepID=UPI0011B59DF1|nr:TFIIB-type zinc ribbon-containing protein [Planococcus sp. CPCC 101016]TWT05368.1 TFIIB-type zinc ribbon-containing protein [Planococcus sp. CPCC 101016]